MYVSRFPPCISHKLSILAYVFVSFFLSERKECVDKLLPPIEF